MSNPILAFLQTQIGKSLTNSPSPVDRWLNGTLTAVGEGTLTVAYTVREEMTNPVGILHGGISAAMLDDVLGITVYSLGNENFFTTVNLNLDYLGSTKLGETVTAQSTIVRKGKNIVHAECRLTNADGKLLVKATTNMLATEIKIPVTPTG